MTTHRNTCRIPLPRGWPQAVKSAQYALAHTRSWAVNSQVARVRLEAENDQLRQHAALLTEELRIKVADIRHIFNARGVDRLPSAGLCEELAKMEERPWPEWRKGRPITTRQLASLLKGFSISPGSIRLAGGSTPKGYVITTFHDAFARYLPPPAATSPQDAENSGKASFPIRHKGGVVADRNRPNTAETLGCGGVADQKEVSGEEGVFDL